MVVQVEVLQKNCDHTLFSRACFGALKMERYSVVIRNVK